MRKIPTVFERDWNGDRSRVLDQPVAECQWVFDGEGVATRKHDGTAVAVINGSVFKRHEIKPGKDAPAAFLKLDHDEETGKTVGWVPAGDGPEDKWLREAVADSVHPERGFPAVTLPDGTFELVGPKIQGNPEGYETHRLIRHSDAEPYIVPRTFEGMRALLSALNVEGFVFHHEDGRMAKIKARDFGIKRP